MNKRANMESNGDINMEEPTPTQHQNLAPNLASVPWVAPIVPYKPLPAKDFEEWEYNMRRNMQEIIPGLFLGPYAAASKTKLDELKGHGITHIVCVRHVMERNVIRPVHTQDIQYLVIEMVDDLTESLIPHCLKAHKFLNDCFASGGKVLVHGNAGMSRSASIVVAYVMAIYGVTLKEAMSYVQSKRFSANPSHWFVLQLKEYEPIYRALHDTPHPLPVEGQTTRPTLKRQRFDLEVDDMDMDTLSITD